MIMMIAIVINVAMTAFRPREVEEIAMAKRWTFFKTEEVKNDFDERHLLFNELTCLLTDRRPDFNISCLVF